MSLGKEQIIKNRDKFIELLNKIQRENFKVEELIKFLDNSDFFIAPASTKYHGNYAGGLCEHCLKVYSVLNSLCSNYAYFKYDEIIPSEIESEEPKTESKTIYLYDESSIIVVSLFHELYKANFYTQYTRNKLDDTSGNWVKVNEYKVKDATERITFGSKNFNSYILLTKYISLTEEETAAIINFNSGLDKTENIEDICTIFKKYNLVTLLHCADMICTYSSNKEKKEAFITSLNREPENEQNN